MGSLNRIILMGNLGQNPEVRATKAGRPVGNFSLATNEGYTKEDGTRAEKTVWHRVVVWGELATNCGKYLQKGSTALVEGRVEYNEYQDKEGRTHLSPEIIASNVQFLSRAKGAAAADTKGGEGKATDTQAGADEAA